MLLNLIYVLVLKGGENMGNGLMFGGTATYILMILIKIFFSLFVLGLVGGLIVWIKNNVFTAEERESIKGVFTGKKAVVKEICSTCRKELSREWKVCPYCGYEKSEDSNI
jgi:hypothetical protein